MKPSSVSLLVSTILLLILVACVVALASCNFMEHAHCDDTVVKRVLSPDGKLERVISNRSCSSGSGPYTYAKVEERGNRFAGTGSEFCFLVTLAGGYHDLNATWIDQSTLNQQQRRTRWEPHFIAARSL